MLCVMRSGILAHTFPVAVNTVEVTVNQDLRALIVREGVDPNYLAHFLRFSGEDILHRCSKHGTTVSSIEASRLDAYQVPLPVPETQRRIVARIDELFAELNDGEEDLRRARADLKTYRKALLRAAVTGDLTAEWRGANPVEETGADLLERVLADRRERWLNDPKNRGKRYKEPVGPDTAGLRELPSNWAWATVRQISDYVTSGSRGWSRYYSPAGATFIRAQDINRDVLDLNDIAHVTLPSGVEGTRSRVRRDDILITITGANVTKTALVHAELEEAFVSQHVALLRMNERVSSSYTWLWLVTPSAGRMQLEKAAYGAGKPGLNLPNILDVTIALPPRQEQAEIFLIASEALVQANEMVERVQLRDELEPLRQSILAAAFRGELVQ